MVTDALIALLPLLVGAAAVFAAVSASRHFRAARKLVGLHREHELANAWEAAFASLAIWGLEVYLYPVVLKVMLMAAGLALAVGVICLNLFKHRLRDRQEVPGGDAGDTA